MSVSQRYGLEGAELLRTAPIYLVECENSMQDFVYELTELEKRLEKKKIFAPGGGEVLELYSVCRQKEDGSWELGFVNREGAYLPGYEQWMLYLSGRERLQNAVVAIHVRDTDPQMITDIGWRQLWKSVASYKAHTLVFVIVDADTREAVLETLKGNYFVRRLAFSPLTDDEKADYFLAVLQHYDIRVDEEQVRAALLKRLEGPDECTRRDLSLLAQGLIWVLAVDEEGSSRGKGDKEKEQTERDDTQEVLQYINAKENRSLFRQVSDGRTMGFR